MPVFHINEMLPHHYPLLKLCPIFHNLRSLSNSSKMNVSTLPPMSSELGTYILMLIFINSLIPSFIQSTVIEHVHQLLTRGL